MLRRSMPPSMLSTDLFVFKNNGGRGVEYSTV